MKGAAPFARGPLFTIAAAVAFAWAFFGGLFGRRRRDYVSPETLGRIAMPDGAGESLPLASGERGDGRRDLDACDRADRARREAFRRPFEGRPS